MARKIEAPELLTPSEVADLFKVDVKTVSRWAKAGRLTSMRTVGGHRRYLASEIRLLLTPERLPRTPINNRRAR